MLAGVSGARVSEQVVLCNLQQDAVTEVDAGLPESHSVMSPVNEQCLCQRLNVIIRSRGPKRGKDLGLKGLLEGGVLGNHTALLGVTPETLCPWLVGSSVPHTPIPYKPSAGDVGHTMRHAETRPQVTTSNPRTCRRLNAQKMGHQHPTRPAAYYLTSCDGNTPVSYLLNTLRVR